MYELRVWTMPPIIKEVVGRYDNLNDALNTIKKLMIRHNLKIEDFDLENQKTGQTLKIGIKDVKQ